MKGFGSDECLCSLKSSETNTYVYAFHDSCGESQLQPYRLIVLCMQNKPVKEQQRFYTFLRIRKRYAACKYL